MNDVELDSLLLRAKDAPIIRIKHSSLTRSGESPYRSHCSECGKGFLFVNRELSEPFNLRRDDHCILCAQRFWYLDDAINGEVLP
jgi:hypothetical protein